MIWFLKKIYIYSGRLLGKMLLERAKNLDALLGFLMSRETEPVKTNSRTIDIIYSQRYTPFRWRRVFTLNFDDPEWVIALNNFIEEKRPQGMLQGNARIEIDKKWVGYITTADYIEKLRDPSSVIMVDAYPDGPDG
jgi:hypothetical protein